MTTTLRHALETLINNHRDDTAEHIVELIFAVLNGVQPLKVTANKGDST